LSGSYDRKARLWQVAAPVVGSVDQIEEWVHVLTAQEFGSGGVIQTIAVPAWRDARRYQALR
jgi:hypothetical protein